jgi:tetratricopeptide (TPR) repeat protein
MDKSWDTLTPRELRNAKIFSVIFIVISILILIFLNETIGKILLGIGVIFGLGPFILGSKGSMKNMIHVLKTVEPGYNDWEDEKIEKQIKAIQDCGYRWFEQKGKVGFEHTKTGLYLRIDGLHFYNPKDIKKTYREVWSKDDPAQVRKRDTAVEEMEKLGEIMQLVARGTMLGQSGDFDGAIEALKEAIKIDPEYAVTVAYVPLAMAYRGKNMLDKALEILHQVEKKDNDLLNFDLFFTFVTIYIRKDDKTNAVKYAKKAIEANENPETKETIKDATEFGVINSGELNREPIIEGLKELIKE